MDKPTFPKERDTSSNGIEIWEAFGKLSEYTHQQNAIRKARERLYDAEKKKCGDCSHWMIQKQCPREAPGSNAFRKGPSMSGFACGEFDRSQWSIDFVKQRKAGLKELLEKAAG